MRQLALEKLLPWLNDGEEVPDRTVRRKLQAFLQTFDGSADAGFLRVYADAGTHELFGGPQVPEAAAEHHERFVGPLLYEPVPAVGTQELGGLRAQLLGIIGKGFPYEARPHETPDGLIAQWNRLIGERVADLPSLRFGVRRRVSERVGTVPKRLSTAAHRRFRSEPGAYEVLVDGNLRDLVPYLVMRELTLPGAAALGRCPAPAPGQRGHMCGRLFMLATTGRPRKYCSDKCKVRDFTTDDEGNQVQARGDRKERR